MIDDVHRDLVRHAAAGETLALAAEALRSAGILLMPLKGVWLQRVVYPEAGARTLTDVDVLAPPGRFEEALALLQRAGFVATAGSRAEITLEHTRCLLPLDLHRDLFARGAFALDTAGAFARGRVDTEVFGTEVVAPDPRDVLAHLIGHLVKSRGADAGRYAEDMRRLARIPDLDPADTARHLHAVGVARAARMVLPLAADEPAVAAVLAALPPDPVGAALARVAQRAQRALAGRQPFQALPSYLVDRSLAAGARALLLRRLDRAQDWRR